MAQPLINEPRDLLLGEDNDLVVDADLSFSRGITGVAQACRVAVQMFAEEWFLDLDVGIPYLQNILAKNRRVGLLAAKTAFRKELLSVLGVLEILVLDTEFESTTRTLKVTWQVRTSLGNTPMDVLSVTGII